MRKVSRANITFAHDIVEQFNFVDFGLTFDGVRLPEEREKARILVQSVLKKRGLFVRHLKHEVLPGLPQKRFQRVLVPLQPIQEKIYRSVLSGLIEKLKRTDNITFRKNLGSFLAKRITLLQVCSNPVSVISSYTETPAKLLALDGLLDELIARQGEKVVLWSFYTASIDRILARYARFNPVRYDGTVNSVVERRLAVDRFQTDNETMLFVANPAAAGAGLTLHRAKYAVYESLSNQAAHYLQSLDRIHRRGQSRDVDYLVLLGARTIEVNDFATIVEKERAAQMLLGDRVNRSPTRETMLRDVLAAAELLESWNDEAQPYNP